MLAGGEEGHVVNTASVAGLTATPGMGPYCVSKFGVVALSETLHHELALQGAALRVSVLCPAWVSTRISDSERNRPAALGELPAQNPQEAMMRDVVRGLVAAGLAPTRVAELVLEAIREERFYVLTHPDFMPLVRQRMEGILEQRNPSFGGFGR
jgi:short-subunit dehydrogenase